MFRTNTIEWNLSPFLSPDLQKGRVDDDVNGVTRRLIPPPELDGSRSQWNAQANEMAPNLGRILSPYAPALNGREFCSLVAAVVWWLRSWTRYWRVMSSSQVLLKTRHVEGAKHPAVGVVGNYTRAFGDGPRNFEPWSSGVDDPELPLSPNYHTTPTGGRFSSRQDRKLLISSNSTTQGLDGLPICATEVRKNVDLSEPMNSDSDAEMDHETLIKTVTFFWKL
ncbi:hypothetical protein TNCV_4176261 [Trichonephila clavipes]|nr:hypothetical protein TNCV_4176261 [Trichonephila clavipes]